MRALLRTTVKCTLRILGKLMTERESIEEQGVLVGRNMFLGRGQKEVEWLEIKKRQGLLFCQTFCNQPGVFFVSRKASANSGASFPRWQSREEQPRPGGLSVQKEAGGGNISHPGGDVFIPDTTEEVPESTEKSC